MLVELRDEGSERGKALTALRAAISGGRLGEADLVLRQFLVANPTDAGAWFNLSTLDHSLNRLTRARIEVRRAAMVNQDPGLAAKAENLFGRIAARRPIAFSDASTPEMSDAIPGLHYLNDSRRPIMLVYQPGRVGSTGVYELLSRRLVGRYVGSHHVVSRGGCAILAKALDHIERFGRCHVRHAYGARVSFHVGNVVRRHVEAAMRGGRPIDVVTMVRDPLDHEISNFMYHLPLLFPALLNFEWAMRPAG
jgi:hypothetical protein